MYQSFDLKLPDWYKNNNPKILAKIRTDLAAGNQFNYLFMGCVGSGKTLLAEFIFSQINETNSKIEAMDIYQEYLRILKSDYTDKNTAIEKRLNCLRKEYLLFDDLGTEKPSTDSSRHFMEQILMKHYNYVKHNNSCSIITTNLTGNEIAERYGNRILDRFHELFTIMKFKKYSFRRENPVIIEG